MTLKYKWHSYSEVYEREVEVPDDTVFIHVDGDIGTGLHSGFGHYLGGHLVNGDARLGTDGTDTLHEVGDGGGGGGLRRYSKFPGITLLAFSDVVFETEINVITAEEFYSRFDIGNYYIFHHTRVMAEYAIINEGDALPIVPTKIIPSRLVSVSKIVGIRSQYLVDVMTCTVSSWLNSDREAKGISFDRSLHLFKLLDDNHCDVVVRKDCDREFTDALNQVLGIVGKEVFTHGDRRSALPLATSKNVVYSTASINDRGAVAGDRR